LKRTPILLIALLALVSACTTAPAPVVTPRGDDAFLVDPRTGYQGTASSPKAADAQAAAWRFFLSGDYEQARLRIADARKRDSHYAPTDLTEAAIAIRQGAFAEAQAMLDKLPPYTATIVYRAELAFQEHDLRRALSLYRDVMRDPLAAKTAASRVGELEKSLYDQTYHDAVAATGPEAIRLLREALQFQPGATGARILLAQKLVAARQYEDARRELEPVIGTGDVDRTDVQETLAEIDAGRGRFQEAIIRYDRLARREHDNRFTQRVEELKEQFAAANMPVQFQRALESDSITRADFAVLLYWKVSSVRFAQNVGAPPIAVDVTELPGRDELIRAIALGIFNVDPVTRRVGPGTPVNAATLAKLAARVLAVRGAACARVPASDPQKVLSACGMADPSAVAGPDAPVSGKTASAVLDGIDKALK
jgi:tetratricopeptide (TPR) repeat protein